MKKIFILILFGLGVFHIKGEAQGNWEYRINAGYNLGGSTPLSMPVEIRAIKKYSFLGFAPHFALETTYWMDDKWGVSAQIACIRKGFTVRDKVKHMHTEIEIDGNADPQTGSFTGDNTTEIRNTYLTVPVLATYRISNTLITQLGVYLAYLYRPYFKGTASNGYIRIGNPTGVRMDISNASFDFSKNQNRFDYGLVLAEEWQFYKNFALKGQLNWGLHSLFPSDFSGISFDMYNIYGTFGISYRLSK
jgi:hypothetical protein